MFTFFRTPPGSTSLDPFWDDTLLLLHGDGADGSTTLVNSAPVTHSITAFDGAAVDTDYKRFGTGSIFLDGVDDFVLINTWSTYVSRLQNSFTIETEFRPLTAPTLGNGATSIQMLYSYRDTDAARTFLGYSYWLGLQSTPGIWLRIDTGGSTLNLVADATLPLTETSHIAVTCDHLTDTFRIFVNGTLLASTTSTIRHASTLLANLNIGFGWSSSFRAGGWFDDYRVTAACRYTSSFTRPAAAHPDG